MTDNELIARFEHPSRGSESFNHADHVRLAFLYLGRHPSLDAIARVSDGLMRFAAAAGKPELYNETVTWAYLLLIRERMARSTGQLNWPDFARKNSDLLMGQSGILKKYYLPETLKSGLAKGTFLMPDRFIIES